MKSHLRTETNFDMAQIEFQNPQNVPRKNTKKYIHFVPDTNFVLRTPPPKGSEVGFFDSVGLFIFD